jgi:hypothetical protein
MLTFSTDNSGSDTEKLLTKIALNKDPVLVASQHLCQKNFVLLA